MTSQTTLRRALSLMTRQVEREHFFGRLHSADWIPGMRAENLFSTPPGVVRDGEYVQFPGWPELQFVERVAGQAPDEAAKVMSQIPETDNFRTHLTMAAIALKLRTDDAASWLLREAKWIDKQDWLWDPLADKLAELIAKLAKEGEAKATLAATRSLFCVLPDSHPAIGSGDFRLPPTPKAKFDAWEYGQALSVVVRPLTDCLRLEAVRLFADLLERAIELSLTDEPTDRYQDYSAIWRDGIEHGDYEDGNVRDVLVSAVRDASNTLASSQCSEVVQELESREWVVFRRIAWNTIRVACAADVSLIANRLLRREYFFDSDLHHEYATLLQDNFGRLREEARNTILSWIDAGYDLRAAARRHLKNTGEKPTAAELDSWKEHWQRDRLSPIKDSLPEDWRSRYESLVEKHGPPVFDFVQHRVWTGTGSANRSPVSLDELSAMSPAEIRGMLSTWRPKSEMSDSESLEGLDETLMRLPAEFFVRESANAAEWEGLAPRFISTFIRSLADAVKTGKEIHWDPVIRLALIAAKMPGDGWDFEWLRRSTADLLIHSFNSDGPSRLPATLGRDAWRIIETLMATALQEHEPATGESAFGNLTGALNSVSGRALEASIRYAIWEKNNAKAQGPWSFRDRLPWAADALSAWTNPSFQIRLDSRAIIGVQLESLFWLDEKWVLDHLASFFPEAPELRPQRDVVWNTYVYYGRPFGSAIRLLRGEFAKSIVQLPQLMSTDRARDVAHRLAEHLMTHYWRGGLSFGDPDQLLEKFFVSAPVSVRAAAVEFLGRNLRSSDLVSTEVVVRLQDLFDRRVEFVTSTGDRSAAAELVPFGWWFASGKIGEDWSLDRLIQVLRLAGEAEPDHQVAEGLIRYVSSHPLGVAEALRLQIEGSRHYYSFTGWRDEAREVLERLIESGDPKTQRAARAVIDLLIERGQMDFLDLAARPAATRRS